MLKFVTEYNLSLKKAHKYFLYILIFTFIVMCISWSFYPERSARIYAKLVHKIGLKRKEIEHQTCFQDTIYAIQMNDRVMMYLEESYLKGTQQFLKKKKDIHKLVLQGDLILIE
jgi:hypothetical protein